MKKILVTGANGQLGNSLRLELASDPELEVVYTDVDELDITNREAVQRFISDGKFDIIINCAAYTAVDKAEANELAAARLNTQAIGYIAETAARHKVKVIHISTDYVFSGEHYRPYRENDEPFPQTIYGRTKLEGEAVLTSFCPEAIIIRTAWLYSQFGNNFVLTMLRRAKENNELRVVADQIGTPTFAGDLASIIHTILNNPKWLPGIYHFSNEGVASWYDFTKSIMRLSNNSRIKVTPIETREYPTPTRRPHYSVLGKKKIKQTFNVTIPYWEESLEKCLELINQ